jgi:hypothetical protein
MIIVSRLTVQPQAEQQRITMMRNTNPRTRFIYIVLSKTPTRFGVMIRRMIKDEYNHASIAFDEQFRELYSFGRYQYKVPLVAGLVKEYPERFSLLKKTYIQVRVYKIPVTQEQFQKGKRRISQIVNDEDGYLYNLFSVLSFPLTGGFATFKAYSCVEFVTHLLRYMNIPLSEEKPEYRFTPEDIRNSLELFLTYEGNLLDYCSASSEEARFFLSHPNYVLAAGKSMYAVARLLYRMVRHHGVSV